MSMEQQEAEIERLKALLSAIEAERQSSEARGWERAKGGRREIAAFLDAWDRFGTLATYFIEYGSAEDEALGENVMHHTARLRALVASPAPTTTPAPATSATFFCNRCGWSGPGPADANGVDHAGCNYAAYRVERPAPASVSPVAGAAKCGCVHHAEDGAPCEHDRALVAASVPPEGAREGPPWACLRHDWDETNATPCPYCPPSPAKEPR